MDDRKPVPELTKGCFGTLYADKGYLSKQLAHTLKERGLELITKVRRNTKRVVLSAFDQAILRRRSLVETVFHELKNLCQIERSRHRSPLTFLLFY